MRLSPSNISRRDLRTFVTALSLWPWTFPLALLLLSSISQLQTPANHTLLIRAISWGIVAGRSYYRIGLSRGSDQARRKKLCWAAGGLYALAQVCERAAYDREGIWRAKALLPGTLYGLDQIDFGTSSKQITTAFYGDPSDPGVYAPTLPRIVFATTISAALALNNPYVTTPTFALGLCSVLLTAFAIVFLELALSVASDERFGAVGGLTAANGRQARGRSSAAVQQNAYWYCLRDFSAVATIAFTVATFAFEEFRFDGLEWRTQYASLRPNWKSGQLWLGPRVGLVAVFIGVCQNLTMVTMVSQQGAFRTGVILLVACVVARLLSDYSDSWQAWFSLICACSSFILFFDIGSSSKMPAVLRKRRGLRKLLIAITVVSLIVMTLRSIGDTYYPLGTFRMSYATVPMEPIGGMAPMGMTTAEYHPIKKLIEDAEQDFDQIIDRQSKTLQEATAEYRRRYKMPPPPFFDRWYQFAKKRNVQLIDEFDAIYHSLLPFWALEPKTIRSRVREAIGFDDNAFIGIMIRDGRVTTIEGGPEWQQQATLGMLQKFAKNLPDMDLAFNVHDEPRVILAHDTLSRMIKVALDEKVPEAFANERPKNAFSPRPKDMNNGKGIDEVWTTRFNRYAHQPTWSASRISCSPDSPARSFDDAVTDNYTAYALSELGFVYNHTAFSDICNSPSLRTRFGFFDRPNAFSISQDLVPVFSQSKISSFQDIIYPSPWYWFKKVAYEQKRDMIWSAKKNQLYWRGSTTGGFSREGGWRRQHRQHVVERFNAMDQADILENRGTAKEPVWTPDRVPRTDYKDLVDVKFSHIGQCDPDDCDAQKEFFEVAPTADQQDAWGFRHLLDMDGNGFSGRFFAFMQSKSMVYKMALFREWHKDWLKPWVHYVPFSLRGDEWLEAVRYFSQDEEGMQYAPRLASQGSDWSKKVLREEDFEVWFFRLLLEYGRLIDDNREIIGYKGE